MLLCFASGNTMYVVHEAIINLNDSEFDALGSSYVFSVLLLGDSHELKYLHMAISSSYIHPNAG